MTHKLDCETNGVTNCFLSHSVCLCVCNVVLVCDRVGVSRGVILSTPTGPWWWLRGGRGLGTVAGPGVGAWPWGGRIPSSTLHRDRRWGWGTWGAGGPSRGASRLSELRPWLSVGWGGAVGGGGGAGSSSSTSTISSSSSSGSSPDGVEKGGGGRVRCSRRLCVLLGSLVLVFLTSLFFSVSLRGGVGFNYLEPPGWEESRRVKLVPSYAGAHRLSLPDPQQQKTCACPRCVGDPGVSDWFDENYDPDISPVWTRDNIQLSSDVYYWWVVSKRIIYSH